MQHRSYFKVPVLRSEPYRMLVAMRPCIHCGLWGSSQAAHPNKGGKGKGVKLDDRLCFPLCCTRMDRVGCHEQHDQYKLLPAPLIESTERAWGMRTRAGIIADGDWPVRLPRLDDG